MLKRQLEDQHNQVIWTAFYGELFRRERGSIDVRKHLVGVAASQTKQTVREMVAVSEQMRAIPGIRIRRGKRRVAKASLHGQ